MCANKQKDALHPSVCFSGLWAQFCCSGATAETGGVALESICVTLLISQGTPSRVTREMVFFTERSLKDVRKDGRAAARVSNHLQSAALLEHSSRRVLSAKKPESTALSQATPVCSAAFDSRRELCRGPQKICDWAGKTCDSSANSLTLTKQRSATRTHSTDNSGIRTEASSAQ